MPSLTNLIKEELLCHQIKAPCCKSSFICGLQVFEKNRKNEMTDKIEAYKAKLSRVRVKKNTFFDDEIASGYTVGEGDGKKIPISSGKLCPLCHAHLVRGAFLSCGRASVSGGGIHIEMALPDKECADILTAPFDEIQITPKRTVRRGEYLIYYKKRDTASDFLAYIGAVDMSFNMIQDFILNQNRSKAIRITNCDTSNIAKTVSASKLQCNAIKAILDKGSFDELSPELRETAMIRYENQSDSLEAVAALHESRISRSGVNHRLAKIIEFAKKKGYITD